MIHYIQVLLLILAATFKSRRRLAAENVVLRHQVLIIRRKHRGRVRLYGLDRGLLIWLSRLVPAIRDAVVIVKPETLLRWHRRGFRAFWRWKSGFRIGRPLVDREVRLLILRMAPRRIPWGRTQDSW